MNEDWFECRNKGACLWSNRDRLQYILSLGLIFSTIDRLNHYRLKFMIDIWNLDLRYNKQLLNDLLLF